MFPLDTVKVKMNRYLLDSFASKWQKSRLFQNNEYSI